MIDNFLKITLIACQVLFLMTTTTVNAEVVRFPGGTTPEDKRWDYLVKVLELALQKTQNDAVKDSIERLPSQSQDRRIIELKQNRLDVAFGIGSRSLENEGVLVLPYPLSRGIVGWRILLTRIDALSILKEVRNLDDLKRVRAGFARTFADRKIMDQNGLQMVLGEDYFGLFSMLDKGRFDYLPRGISEVFVEYERIPNDKRKNIVIEPSLVLHYDADWYFLVNPFKLDLAKRIEKGLLIAWHDGSLDSLFWEMHKNHITAAQLSKRKMIKLTNFDQPTGKYPRDWPITFCDGTREQFCPLAK